MGKTYRLSEFVDNSAIIKDGVFETVGSANIKDRDNVLCYASNSKFLEIAEENSNISAIITTKDLKDRCTKAVAMCDEPVFLYGEILNVFINKGLIKPFMSYKISKSAIIDKSAFISSKCYIGNNVTIGKNVIIHEYTIIEDGCIIGDNVVLGCEGFYFRRKKNGEVIKFLHAGGVHLHKNVEIMTGSMVQRAHDAEFTTIGSGTKISVNVNIGHSCKIGENNIITGKVQVAGWSSIGDNCWVGTSSVIADYVTIGSNANIKVGSVVVKDVKENEVVSGNFAYSHAKRIRNFIRESLK
ncbi:hypothetical protein FLM55_03380 [Francisella sp. Scap27]|uniref:hypothetical protein n=1 Tax=Francisella sp. Scap27 TaxID=2589986 RepID=UPI0015B90641|nr:hypothetical protein [Francisella sp. Scap27]QLE78832.1 hypothetical protein FLM55_03380 [Francisella sp. Scap27]